MVLQYTLQEIPNKSKKHSKWSRRMETWHRM